MNHIQCPIYKIASSLNKNKIAIQNSSDSISYLQLNEFIQNTSSYLVSLGIKKNIKVGLLCPNGIDFIVHYFALLRIGAIACLLNSRWPSGILKEELIRLDLSFLISPTKFIKSKKIKHIQLNDKNKVFEFGRNLKFKVCRYHLENISNIMFTSGSSDEPKSVVHTIGNHYYSALGSNDHIPLTYDDGWMLSLPAYHVAGLSILWRAFIVGASVSIVSQEESLAHNVIRLKPTHISMVMAQLIHCMSDLRCRKVLSKMKCILLGGSAINLNVIKAAIKHKLPIYISYGLTEMSSQVATSRRIRTMNDMDSVTVLKYRRLKIDSKQNILVQGKTLFKGYYIRGRVHKAADKNGWFATGDLGVFNKDKGLKVIGRSDHMFISGGENIYPEQIEKEILKYNMIEQAVVVPVFDLTFGQRPVVFLKTSPGKKFDCSKLINYLSSRLEKYKIPKEFYYLPELEVFSTIKVSRKKLTLLAANNSSLLVKVI